MWHRWLMGVLLLMPVLGLSQKMEHQAFQPGEKVRYKAYYNWGFIWVHAGNVLFEVDQVNHRNQKAYRFQASGRSLKSYDWIFKVRDHFSSLATKSLLNPRGFRRNTYEGGYAVENEYIFDHNRSKIYTQVNNSKEPYKEDTLSMEKRVFDVLTAIYYARNLDFSKYDVNQKIPLNLIIDNKIYELYLRYQGQEEIKIRGDQHYNCIKFSAMLVEGTIFSGGEHLSVWVTNDQNRIPVMVKSKILVGSVKAILQSAENLKHPTVLSNVH